jgi:hypothetical protein
MDPILVPTGDRGDHDRDQHVEDDPVGNEVAALLVGGDLSMIEDGCNEVLAIKGGTYLTASP